MPDYRAYCMDGDHTVGPPLVLNCDDDEAAIAQALEVIKTWTSNSGNSTGSLFDFGG